MLAGLLLVMGCGGEGRRAQEVALGDSTPAVAPAVVDSVLRAAVPSPPPAETPPVEAESNSDLPPVNSMQAATASATIARLGLAVQPARGQGIDRTVRDELFCSDSTTGQTGMDPLDRSAGPDSSSLAVFRETMSLCLEGRGYEVK